MAIQVRLDRLLEERAMTVAQLATAIGITPANVFVLKNGHARAVRFSTLDEICQALNCQPGDVLQYVPSKDA